MNTQEHEGILIGKIKYTNVWPVFHYFESDQLPLPASLVTEVPSKLNRRMLEHTLDLSPVSSFSYGSASEKLLLLPDLSVSTDGPVHSILVFSRKPLKDIRNGRFALTNTSATSVNLLKIIMERAYEGKPTYWDSEPILEKMMEDSDAALLIGDQAIQASWQDHDFIVTDLGEVWRKWTGYGMTFAVWTVQRSLAEQHPEFVSAVCEAFQNSKARSMSNLKPLVDKAMVQIGGTAPYWHHYFSNLRYDFTQQRQAGLALYYAYARELGLLDHEVVMDVWNDNKLIRVKE